MDIHELTLLLMETESLFNKNELAYLSLTSKNEFIIRDKLAYLIHQQSNFLVAREYNRIDLALFNGEVLQTAIELKSMYTFDVLETRSGTENSSFRRFINSTKNDFEKNAKYVSGYTKQFAIIIATHPKNKVSKSHSHCVKYSSAINSVSDPTKLVNLFDEKIKTEFDKKLYSIKQICIAAGTAFEIDVDIYMWIVEKL